LLQEHEEFATKLEAFLIKETQMELTWREWELEKERLLVGPCITLHDAAAAARSPSVGCLSASKNFSPALLPSVLLPLLLCLSLVTGTQHDHVAGCY